jgi:hypothetical protein
VAISLKTRIARALEELDPACRAAGIRRLVVGGGSPDTRRELGVLNGRLEPRTIDGPERGMRDQADRDLAWADFVVVCGASALVSLFFAGAKTSTPGITAS